MFFAGLGARVTMDWSRSSGAAPSRGAAPGGSAQMLDGMIAARQRVTHAMRAVGPEHAGILLDVCGFLKRLEVVECEHGWPVRSAKVVLLQALSMLGCHYGLTKPGAGATQAGRIRQWASDGFRPDLSEWEAHPARQSPKPPHRAPAKPTTRPTTRH